MKTDGGGKSMNADYEYLDMAGEKIVKCSVCGRYDYESRSVSNVKTGEVYCHAHTPQEGKP